MVESPAEILKTFDYVTFYTYLDTIRYDRRD